MITIPAITDPVTSSLIPSQPIPSNAIAVVCDGTNYTVYLPGDTVPAQFQG